MRGAYEDLEEELTLMADAGTSTPLPGDVVSWRLQELERKEQERARQWAELRASIEAGDREVLAEIEKVAVRIEKTFAEQLATVKPEKVTLYQKVAAGLALLGLLGGVGVALARAPGRDDFAAAQRDIHELELQVSDLKHETATLRFILTNRPGGTP